MNLPSVSCMCLTYGRPHVLEEAVESFLRQDYPGDKELVVLNDLSEQTLRCDHPQVRVVNLATRFYTVGAKRNYCASLCSHDILFVWDDDDIYLPHRLSFTIKKMNEPKYCMFFKPTHALTLNSGIIGGPNSNTYHSSSAWRRELFDSVNGYTNMGSGQDQDLERRFQAHNIAKYLIKLEEIYYLYRWTGINTYHLSSFGMDKEGKPTGNERVDQFVQRCIKQGTVPVGEVELQPQWTMDYIGLVKDYIDVQKDL